jgi:drug/metabolite transporter (DMT)-like permease
VSGTFLDLDFDMMRFSALPGPAYGHTLVAPLACAVLAPLLWAGNFVIGRAVTTMDPVVLNMLRWIVAAVVLLPVLLRHWRSAWATVRTRPAAVAILAGLGVVGFNSVLYAGLAEMPAGSAGVVFGVTPLLILGLSRAWGGRPVTARALQGAALAFAGIALVLGGGAAAWAYSWQGPALVGLSALIFALYTVALQRLRIDLRSDVLLALTVWAGLLLMAPVLARVTPDLRNVVQTPGLAAAVLYLGLGASVAAFYLWSAAVRGLGPQRTGQFLQLIPVFGVGLAALFLAEDITPAKTAGLGAVVIGVIWAQRGCPPPANRPA